MLFRYLRALWRYRGTGAARYIRAGIGLERRAQHLAPFWTVQLSRSRAAQARWMQTCGGGTLTVLGAGALLDLNSGALLCGFERLRLVDANPLSLEHWRRLSVPVEPVIIDISRFDDTWREQRRKFRGSWTETLEALQRLGGIAVPAYAPAGNAVLSLNILSQLEVGWQESVETWLKRRFGRRFVSRREQDWLAAIKPASRMLAEQHLAALNASGARDILLISDAEYVDYTGRNYQRHRLEEPPLRWTPNGWEADAGVSYEVTPALEGLQLNADLLRSWLPAHELVWQESWLWHISPAGIEDPAKGIIHRVAAFALRQRDAGLG